MVFIQMTVVRLAAFLCIYGGPERMEYKSSIESRTSFDGRVINLPHPVHSNKNRYEGAKLPNTTLTSHRDSFPLQYRSHEANHLTVTHDPEQHRLVKRSENTLLHSFY